MVYTKAQPAAGIAAKNLDDLIRTNNTAIQAALDQDHVFDDNASTQSGEHRQVKFSGPISTPTYAANKAWVYTKDVGSPAVVELHFLDESNNEIQLTHAGAHGYVDRGDPSSADYIQSDLTADNAWHDLDLGTDVSIPGGVVAVSLALTFADAVAGSFLALRKNGNSNTLTESIVFAEVINNLFYADAIVSCDSSQIIEYRLYTADTLVPTTAIITVKGWWF